MTYQGIEAFECINFNANKVKKIGVDVIVEKSVSLTVNNDVWLEFMCTPVDVEALAVGFLFNESIINNKNDIASVRLCPEGDNVDVWLNFTIDPPKIWKRTSGCTGGVSAAELKPLANRHFNHFVISPDQIDRIIEKLFETQDLYRLSGGVHTSALSDGKEIIIKSEDIGRHNTLDKISGRCLLEGIQLPQNILLTTGRISSEMLQKSSRLGVAMVISRTSPSSKSIIMADEVGITLIGYARRKSFKIYTRPERITINSAQYALKLSKIQRY
jgi:FdhD protein